jgi:hypothetical protein
MSIGNEDTGIVEAFEEGAKKAAAERQRNEQVASSYEPIETGFAELAEEVPAKAAAKKQQNEQPGANAGPPKPSEQQPGPNASQAGGERGDRLGKPSPIKPEFENFPAELKSLPNWVLWRYLPPKSNGGKWRKVPFQPNWKTADTTDRSTWSRLEECCAAYARGGFDGVGFVLDGEIGADGLCYCGVDLDSCIEKGKEVHSLARSRIKRLNTYTECSVSGTGIHCIARAKPLDRIVKFDGVEIYTSARYFTFTGRSFGEIKPAPKEVCALVEEVRAKEAAAKQQLQIGHSGSQETSNNDLTDPFNNTKPDPAFAMLADAQENLSNGIKTTPWFATLSPELKNEVVDCALGAIAKNSRLLELEADGGNNAEYYKLTTAVARSGAPNAEDIFVKHASSAKNADPDEALRQHFSRCCASQPLGSREITVGTLLLLAQQNGANFDQWKCQAPGVPALPPVTWSPAELRVSFSNIPHRRWLYGTYLIRGEITVLAAPGGAGKTALATGMAVEIAAGIALLDENIFGSDLKVLLVNGEDGGIEIHRRIWAVCLAHAHKISGRNLDRLSVAGANDPRVQRLALLQTVRNFSTLDQSSFGVLSSVLEALRPDVLILDPLVAFCGGGNMNDNSVMSQVMRELKRMAAKFDCAVLIVHHTRKGADKKGADDGNAEGVSGAAAIVNLARRAIMPVPMTEKEAVENGVAPSERFRYFKLVDAKSNFAPRSTVSPWYQLHSVELPNPEPPIYPHGDNVQAIARVTLPLLNNAAATADDLKDKRALLDLVARGKIIDEKSYPYSPVIAGKTNERGLLKDAMTAVYNEKMASRQLRPDNGTSLGELRPADLETSTRYRIANLIKIGWLVVGDMKDLMSEPGRFRKGRGLRVAWARTPWPDAGAESGGT